MATLYQSYNPTTGRSSLSTSSTPKPGFTITGTTQSKPSTSSVSPGSSSGGGSSSRPTPSTVTLKNSKGETIWSKTYTTPPTQEQIKADQRSYYQGGTGGGQVAVGSYTPELGTTITGRDGTKYYTTTTGQRFTDHAKAIETQSKLDAMGSGNRNYGGRTLNPNQAVGYYNQQLEKQYGAIQTPVGTYNAITQTLTDNRGNKSSVSIDGINKEIQNFTDRLNNSQTITSNQNISKYFTMPTTQKRAMGIDTTQNVPDWNKKSDIERVVALGNVYSAVASGKTGNELKDIINVNKVPVGKNLTLPKLVGDTTQNESPWQTFDRTGDWLGRYNYQLQGSKLQQVIGGVLASSQGQEYGRTYYPQDTRSPSPALTYVAPSGRGVGETILTTKTTTPFKSYFTGKPVTKIKVETVESLMSKGALGTAFKEEARATPITDIPSGIKNIGLSIAAVPAELGQLVGSSIATNLGLKTVFKEDKEFIFKSQLGTTQMAEIYSPRKALLKTQESFKKDPFGTSIDIGFKGLILFPSVAGFAATKLISKSKLLQKGVVGIEKIASKGESLIARSIYTGKKLLVDQTSLKVALKSSKGVTMGTLRTDVVSKLIGRKTIKLSDITSKDIARAFGEQGKAQYLKFPKSEQELFKRASVGPQAKFIKKTFAKYGISPDDVVGFSAESGKATGLIEAITKKGVVKFKFVWSEPYGKFFASRTATGPFANLGSYDDVVVTFSPVKVPKPSVTVGIGKKGVLPLKGGIKESIKALGYDVSKTSPKLQAYFDKSLRARARPPKLKVLRKIFGEKEVAKGYVVGKVDIKGRFVSSPSRISIKGGKIYRITPEEEFIAPFLTKTKLLGGIKERYFGSAIVKLGGKRIKLNIKQLIPDVSDDVLRTTGKVSTSISKGTRGVTSSITRGAPNIKYINITPAIGSIAGITSALGISKVSSLSLSSATSSISVPTLTSSIPRISTSISQPIMSVSGISTPISKVSTSISSATVSVPTSISSVSTPISTASLSTSTPKISTSISSVSVPISTPSIPRISTSISSATPRISISISKTSVSVPKISVSTPRISITSTSVPSIPTRISSPRPTSVPTRITGISSPIKGISKSYPSISKGISRGFKYPKYKTPSLVSRTPSVSRSLSTGYSTPKSSYSIGRPKYKEQRLVGTKDWASSGRYSEKTAFRDIKSLRNQTTGFGFNTRNDFSISNVFSGIDLMKRKSNLKRSSYSLMNQRANDYNYKNDYVVNFRQKGFPVYKYSSRLIDTDKFNLKTSLKA